MKYLGIDLGASETRFMDNREVFERIPNNVAIIDINTITNLLPSNNNVDSMLDVTIINETANELSIIKEPIRALMGEMAQRYTVKQIKPTGLQRKMAQIVNHISLLVVCALAAKNDIAKGSQYRNGAVADMDIVLALPPSEASFIKHNINSILCGTYSVTFNCTHETYRFDINNVTVFEESYLSMMSHMFNLMGEAKPNTGKYLDSNVLSIDIGESTTDVVTISNGKYVEMSGMTYKMGGNVTRNHLINTIRVQYDISLNNVEADKVLAEGRLRVGNKYVDVAKEVIDAKQKYAAQLVGQLNSYFATTQFGVNSFSTIVASGGGSVPSVYIDEAQQQGVITAEPMSSYISKEITKICDSIEVVTVDGNPRAANTLGAWIMAKVRQAKAS